METLLEKIKPVLEKHVKLDLVETYSYARIYHRGNELKRHKDRDECEISTTLNLGGDPWPIFIEPDKTLGAVVEIDGEIHQGVISGVSVEQPPGTTLNTRLRKFWYKEIE